MKIEAKCGRARPAGEGLFEALGKGYANQRGHMVIARAFLQRLGYEW